MSFERNLNQWLANLANPLIAPQHRVMLLDVGSEFKRYRQLDPRRVNYATNDPAIDLVASRLTAAQEAAGSRRLVIPDGECYRLAQINYWYSANGGGDPTANVNASRLRMKFGNEESELFPAFRLDEFARGGSQLRFGAIPIGLWLLPERQFTLTLLPSGAGADAFDLYVSLLFRTEPRELVEAAGLVNPRGM